MKGQETSIMVNKISAPLDKQRQHGRDDNTLILDPAITITINRRTLPETQPTRPEHDWLAGPQNWLSGIKARLARPQAWLAGPQAWRNGPGGDVRMNRRMYERTENLPILQDFVPYRGRCPKRRF